MRPAAVPSPPSVIGQAFSSLLSRVAAAGGRRGRRRAGRLRRQRTGADRDLAQRGPRRAPTGHYGLPTHRHLLLHPTAELLLVPLVRAPTRPCCQATGHSLPAAGLAPSAPPRPDDESAPSRPPLRRLYTIEWDVPYRMYYQTTVCVAEMFGAICVMMLAVSRLPLHAAHACHRLSTDTP